MKSTTVSIIISIALIGTALLFTGNRGGGGVEPTADNVRLVDGVQIIEIGAKGGYYPRVSLAKADTPTVIKMETKGTFDCSSAVAIPSLNYRETLSPSGVTEIEVPPQKAGTTLQGFCAMGMYNFQVKFD